MNRPTFALFSVMAATTASAGEQPFEIYSTFISQSFSDTAPIYQIVHNMEGDPVDGGELAFTHNQFEMGERWQQFELSYFWRYDYLMEFNSDTAHLIYINQNNIPVSASKTYDVSLQANHIRSQGIGLGYHFTLTPATTGKIRLNYLTADETTDGKLSGQLTTTPNDYSGDLHLDYNYSRDLLLSREEESVDGRGFSLDLDLQWAISPQWQVALEGRDIYSKVRWDDVTYTIADATTNRISYDPDGTLHSIPAVAGIESYRDHQQTLPSRYNLSSRYQLTEALAIKANLFRYDDYNFYQLAMGWQYKAVILETSYDFTARALGVSISHKNVYMALRTDETDWKQARALELALGVNLFF